MNKQLNINTRDRLIIKSLKLLTIVLFCILIIFQVLRMINSQMSYDSAYNSTVAKNLAFGYGYTTSYNEIKLFNPEITTGYPLILPVALGIKLFSNNYWIPYAVVFTINLVLISLILYIPKKFDFLDEKRLWGWRTLLLTILVIPSPNYDLYSVMGEVPTVLLIIISSFILIISKSKPHLFFLSGLIGGLAFSTKSLAILSILPIFFTYLILTYKKLNDLKFLWKNILLFFLGLAIPYLLFETYKLIAMGGYLNYLELKKNEQIFFLSRGSGVNSINYLLPKLLYNFIVLVAQLGYIRFIIFLIFPMFVTLKLLIKNRLTTNENKFLFFMFMSAVLVNTTWFLLLAEGRIRFALIEWTLFLTALSTFIFWADTRSKRIYSVLILLFLTSPFYINFIEPCLAINSLHSKHLNALKEVTKFIQENKQYRYYGCGWWANRDLEYALPTVNNFSSCQGKQNFNDSIHNKVLIRTLRYWDPRITPKAVPIQTKCEKNIILKNDYYIVSLCN